MTCCIHSEARICSTRQKFQLSFQHCGKKSKKKKERRCNAKNSLFRIISKRARETSQLSPCGPRATLVTYTHAARNNHLSRTVRGDNNYLPNGVKSEHVYGDSTNQIQRVQSVQGYLARSLHGSLTMNLASGKTQEWKKKLAEKPRSKTESKERSVKKCNLRIIDGGNLK